MQIQSQKNSPCTMHLILGISALRGHPEEHLDVRMKVRHPEAIAFHDALAAIRAHRRKRVAQYRPAPPKPYLKSVVE